MVLQVKSLNDIPQYMLPPFFRWQHLKQKPVLGFIGNPGEGKSFSMAVTLLVDALLQNEPVWSNMYIKATFAISDRIARMFGLSKGGDAVFEANAVDKMKLLRMDKEYHDGYHGLDEINAEYAESTRSTSNVNLYFDRVEQQHRHDLMGMVYTTIHEMWVDNRVRKLTDAFIKVEDVALSPEGLQNRMPTGEIFKWVVYPKSRLICGWTYEQTGRTLGPYFLHAKAFQGIFDSLQKQAEGQTKYAVNLKGKQGEMPAEIEVRESPEIIESRNKWGWLYTGMTALHHQNVPVIIDEVLWKYLQIEERGISPNVVGQQLSQMGVECKKSNGHSYYIIDNFDIERQRQQVLKKSLV